MQKIIITNGAVVSSNFTVRTNAWTGKGDEYRPLYVYVDVGHCYVPHISTGFVNVIGSVEASVKTTTETFKGKVSFAKQFENCYCFANGVEISKSKENSSINAILTNCELREIKDDVLIMRGQEIAKTVIQNQIFNVTVPDINKFKDTDIGKSYCVIGDFGTQMVGKQIRLLVKADLIKEAKGE